MVTRTAGAVTRHAPTDPAFNQALISLNEELRALYAETFRLALQGAETARHRFEAPDGTGPIDPIYAADTAACRAINRHLTTAVGRYLPGAQLVERIDEPAVIDSHWLYQERAVVIEWDYTLSFRDAQALTVREVTR